MQPPTISPQKAISKTVVLLSLVSLFTDMASEMLYPVMPVFLKQIGFSVLLIGILEGVAEAVAGLSKSYFGKLSDISGKRLPFVQLGYALSAISKPLMGIFVFPVWIFFSRTLDRIGKGIRTGARDALLSDESTASTKGRVFGFHRAMDTMGAAIGPLLALIYLYFDPGGYRVLFFIAFIPGVAAILLTLLVKEKINSGQNISVKKAGNFFGFIAYWKNSPPAYKKLLIGLIFFALLNSSDVFLLLKIKESGMSDTAVIGSYIFYNLVYALLAYPIGVIADKIGLKKMFLAGLLVFAVVYTGFAFSNHLITFIILFFFYGLYAAATESIAKAWISNLVNKNETATAIGTYSGFQSIATLIASSITGLLWFSAGAKITFIVIGLATVLVVLYLQYIETPTNSPD